VVAVHSSGLFVYLFICGLNDDAVSSSECIALNDRMVNE
jgi:hypothetical protein